MKEIHIILRSFDMEAFLRKTIDYLKPQVAHDVDPTYGIVWVGSPGDMPEYGSDETRNFIDALKSGTRMVFFPFAHAEEDDALVCADGNSYKTVYDEQASENGMYIGPEDRLGFLIKM